MSRGRGPADAFDVLLRALARTPEKSPDPTTLLHYRILAKLGEGGMGAVYKAEDTKLGRVVAIKQVAGRGEVDEAARIRLQREARAASALNHPNIVTVFAVEEAGGVDFIVMEHVDGERLDDLVARGPLDLERVLAVGAAIADALSCAHAARVVHRDIKPANIILTPRGPKVLDFGIAKQRHTGSPDEPIVPTLTASRAIVGTAPYMSPEQIRGDELDGRSDLFALGALLYECATGRRAFPGHNLATCVHEITSVDPPAPSSIVSSLPAAFDAIVLRALRKDRSARFANAEEMAEALWSLSLGRSLPPVASRPETASFLFGREAELLSLESRMRAAASGAGSLVLVTGEAGIGKTALLDALVRRAPATVPHAIVARGRCVEQFGEGDAYLPLLDMLDDLLGGPHAAIAREALVAVAPTWSLQLPRMRTAGSLDELLRSSLGGNEQRLLRELSDFLAAIAARAPVLVILDDVHWADPATIDVIQHLAHRIGSHRALVVLTLRASEVEAKGHPLRRAFTDWRAKQEIPEVALAELAAPHVRAWLDARFSPNRFAPDLAAAIHARTEGHTLFVASTIDWLVAEERIRPDADGWHAERIEASTIEIPHSLMGMLRAKLDVLAPEEHQLLAFAAVQGAEFLSAVVADALETDEVAVEERLGRMAATHRLVRMLGEEELPDGALATRWRFAHALYRDVLYDGVASTRRVLVHRKCGESLLRRYANDAGRVAATLAVHFEQGRDFARATAHLIKAAENATSVFAWAQAERLYGRALRCAGRLPHAEQDGTLSLIYRQRALALTATSRYQAAVDDMSLALERARRSGDRGLLGATEVAMADVLLTSHRIDEAVPHIEAALAAAEQEGLASLRGDALGMRALERLIVGDLDACREALDGIDAPGPLSLHLRGLLHYFWSEYADAERAFRAAEHQNQETLADGLLLMESRMFAALAIANQGRLGEAKRALLETMDLAQRNESPVMLARAGNSLGWVYREIGKLDRASEEDARAVRLGREAEESEAEANALLNLEEDRLAKGEVSAPGDAHARVSELASADAWLRWRYGLRQDAVRARQLLARGAVEEARAAAAALRERAASQGAGKYAALGHELEARAALAQGDWAGAARAIEGARAELARKPAPLVGWRVEALAARVAERQGDRAAADAARESALAILAPIAQGLAAEDRTTFLASAEVRDPWTQATPRPTRT